MIFFAFASFSSLACLPATRSLTGHVPRRALRLWEGVRQTESTAASL